MKPVAVIAGLLISSFFVKAQEPVKWTYSSKKIADKTYEVHMTATIDDSWHIYAQQQPKESISVPTKISFNKNPLVTLTGKVKEVGDRKIQSLATLGITQYMYENQVDFVQTVKLKSSVNTSIAGVIDFQTCTEEMCLPEKHVSFKVDMK